MADDDPAHDVWPGQSRLLGATPDDGGVNFVVWAPRADSVSLCLFDPSGDETRLELWEHTLGFWNAYVPGLAAGQRYGFRASGPWDPASGRVFDPDKLLLDPYARAIDGSLTPGAALASRTSAGERNAGDSGDLVPRSVVVDDHFDWGDDRPPSVPWQRTVIYEAHVRGLTMRHPDVPEQLRGTYAGLAHPSVLSYLRDLGVTAVELLPVHHFVSELDLTARGLVNYWGYNTAGYFAPHAAYSSSGAGGEQVREFKEMVRALHAVGIEVILDVVYNHTAESAADGPTLSFRGLDEQAYYRTDAAGRYADVTGCGNTFHVSEPQSLQLVMDSLRYWVTEMHVDGFRFDLASALLRNGPRVDLRAPFLTAVHQDPVLRQVKLIAEPWDATGEGYLVGKFPPQWCEWNDKYRDTVRDFWRGRGDGVRELASRLSGSSDLYADDGRLPFASVNFVTAHDGFTLRDLVSYDTKHNLANGQDNRDGMNENRSWNCGVEGDTDEADVMTLRRRQAANLLGTLLLSTGVPMLTAGDERGRSQQGNNNAFCHDTDLAWLCWQAEPGWEHLHPLASLLLRLRSEHPVLRQRFFFEGKPINGSDRKDITWLQPSGDEMNWTTWLDPTYRTIGVFLAGDQLRMFDQHGQRAHDTSYVFWLHAGDQPVDVSLPAAWADRYVEVVRTDRLEALADPAQRETLAPGTTVRLDHHTMALYEAVAPRQSGSTLPGDGR
jgi:isoamylase